MATTDDALNLIPSVKLLMQKIEVAEAEKAKDEIRRHKNEEAEKKALIDRLSKRSGLSDEEVMKKAATIIERAASNGLTEVQVYRFPNSLCTDHGRAINQQEPGWENTLTGIPKEIYEFGIATCVHWNTSSAFKSWISLAECPATLASP
jgi:hypothetical protein